MSFLFFNDLSYNSGKLRFDFWITKTNGYFISFQRLEGKRDTLKLWQRCLSSELSLDQIVRKGKEATSNILTRKQYWKMGGHSGENSIISVYPSKKCWWFWWTRKMFPLNQRVLSSGIWAFKICLLQQSFIFKPRWHSKCNPDKAVKKFSTGSFKLNL